LSDELEVIRDHPQTGVRVTGRELPDWQSCCDLATRAHVPLSELGFGGIMGWDVALTPEGPVLIEGNPFPAIHETVHPDAFLAEEAPRELRDIRDRLVATLA